MIEIDCCFGLRCANWRDKSFEDILSVVSIVVAGILFFPLHTLPFIASVLWTDILSIRLWIVRLLCVHVSGFVQIASIFEPSWYPATPWGLPYSLVAYLSFLCFACPMLRIAFWIRSIAARPAELLRLSSYHDASSLFQATEFPVAWKRASLGQSLQSRQPVRSLPTKLRFNRRDGGCCISWRVWNILCDSFGYGVMWLGKS